MVSLLGFDHEGRKSHSNWFKPLKKKVDCWLLQVISLKMVLSSETAVPVFRRAHKNPVLHFTLFCSVCWLHFQTVQVGEMAAPAPAGSLHS